MQSDWFDYYVVGSLRDTWEWIVEVGRVFVQPKVIWVWLGAFAFVFFSERDEPLGKRLLASSVVALMFIGLLALIIFAAPLLGVFLGGSR